MAKLNKGDQVFLELHHTEIPSRHFMYVLGYNVTGEVMCYWYSEDRAFHKSDFPEELLTKYTPEPPSFVDAYFIS